MRINTIYPAILSGLLFFACSSDTDLLSDQPTVPSLKGGVGKIEICHYDAVTDEYKTLTLSSKSAEKHLAHGDYIGSCDADGDGVSDDLDQCNDTPAGNPVDEVGCSISPIYLDDNGVTIKSYDWAQVGQTGVLNDITYTIVDEAMLRQMADNGEDVTKVCTTKVTDMSFLFDSTPFNQGISSWDVSNVTDMSWMFYNGSFNQDISSWDVSNVTDMSGVFAAGQPPYGPPISGEYRIPHPFNQPIGNWDVSNVTDMYMMFSKSQFKQPIGDWNVSNVTDMFAVFEYGPFNQDISNWDVGNVTDMDYMFLFARDFNQDISSWNVSNVTTMYYMFAAAFGFNQDLSIWNVNNVTVCNAFSFFTRAWTLPKPNFTNCDSSID